MSPPVLYSLRLCPYAMRARFSLLLAKQTVLLRNIVLSDKPAEMLASSPKDAGKETVPLLVLDNGQVIDESLNIMLWALGQNDPADLLYSHDPLALPQILELIKTCDHDFVTALKKYKCAARYKDQNVEICRQDCEPFISQLEQRLTSQPFLFGATVSLADYALLPFIRQFAKVQKKWFNQAPYPNLQRWLNGHLQSGVYTRALAPCDLWLDGREVVLFPT